MSAPNLSLYKIETELLDLMRFRESVADDPDMTPDEITASLEAIDRQITEYVTREVAKVDGIAAYLRECHARHDVLKAEAQRLQLQADAWAERGERLYAVTLQVMQQTGATLLEGANSTFKVRKNPPSVDVAQPELVPPAYQRQTVTLTVALWRRVLSHLFSNPRQPLSGGHEDVSLFIELNECKISNPEPMKDAIKAELKAGVGVPGCRLVDDKVRLVLE